MMQASSINTNAGDFRLAHACTNLAYAWSQPVLGGKFKQQAEDFQVEEILGFEPDGSGEHLFLFIEKTEMTTSDVQQTLARHFNQALNKVSYSGMKDKMGITRQWFCVQTTMAYQPEATLELPGQIRVITACKNSRKLRIGSHRSNKFRIVVRELAGDRTDLALRLQQVAQLGVPNYFGPQRFGNDCSSLLQAEQWFIGGKRETRRVRRSLMLSAARAFLFNQVLSARVSSKNWSKALLGDVMALSGTASTFAAEKAESDELLRRLSSMDIHPTGPLWGKGTLRTTDLVQELEQDIVSSYETLAQGLIKMGLEQDRRALRLQVLQLHHELTGNDLKLEFTLPKGSYATSVLRELINTDL